MVQFVKEGTKKKNGIIDKNVEALVPSVHVCVADTDSMGLELFEAFLKAMKRRLEHLKEFHRVVVHNLIVEGNMTVWDRPG